MFGAGQAGVGWLVMTQLGSSWSTQATVSQHSVGTLTPLSTVLMSGWVHFMCRHHTIVRPPQSPHDNPRGPMVFVWGRGEGRSKV